MAINLRTVIFELQYILQLSTDNKSDSRIPALLDSAKADLAKAAQDLTHADDIGGVNPPPPPE